MKLVIFVILTVVNTMTGIEAQGWEPWPPSDWPAWPAWPEWPPHKPSDGYMQISSPEISPVVYSPMEVASPEPPSPVETTPEVIEAESPKKKGKGRGQGKGKNKDKSEASPSPEMLPPPTFPSEPTQSPQIVQPLPSPQNLQTPPFPQNLQPPPSPQNLQSPPSPQNVQPPPSPQIAPAFEGGSENGDVFLARPSVPRNATGVLPGVIPTLEVQGLSRPQQTSSGFVDLIAAASARQDLSILVTALSTVSLRTVIENDDFTGTLFAPTNQAFELALSTLGLSLTDLLQDIDRLRTILQYHITPTVLFEEQLDNGLELSTFLQGSSLTVQIDNGIKIIGIGSEANVILSDISAGNGIFHVVDAVLLPFAV